MKFDWHALSANAAMTTWSDGNTSTILKASWHYMKHEGKKFVYECKVSISSGVREARLRTGPLLAFETVGDYEILHDGVLELEYQTDSRYPSFQLSSENQSTPKSEFMNNIVKQVLMFAEEQVDSPLERIARRMRQHETSTRTNST